MRLTLAFLLTLTATFPLAAQRNRLAGPISLQHTVTVSGQVHRHALPAFDRGAVSASFPMNDLSLIMAPSAAQQTDLENFLTAVQDPSSPDYHKWLTPEQFADRFGPSQSDYAQVTAWLEGQGFTIHTLAPS